MGHIRGSGASPSQSEWKHCNPGDEISREVWQEFWESSQTCSFPRKVEQAQLMGDRVWLQNQMACYFLSDHTRLKFHQIIWLLAPPSVSPHSRWGADCLTLGPLAILDQVKGLAHLYSIAPWTFIYFKDRKMRYFGGRWTAFGNHRNDRRKD